MIQKAFLNTDRYNNNSCIVTDLDIYHKFITYSIKIFDGDDSSIALYSTISDDENDLHKLNTLIEHITNLRDSFLFMRNNKEKIFKKYKTKKEAKRFFDFLKENDNLLFEKYKVKTFRKKKKTYYYIGLK
ncbi:hypothetical protein CGC48_00830 [Capnocytophaga cynodegmi]|uniref:Uncharacterized protein n=1 Tax=Capnocytophaga cynodegmi TaxID=28189 RepID=A0A286NTF0_9FLAO|nr:hypothetical protein [Capnocytophaga cynodegmi]ATA67289.1 hypothetical protein CGC48_00830 [Capnocytophaga cynodegmi]